MARALPREWHPCRVFDCEHVATSRAALVRHEMTHSAEPYYTCEAAGCSYASKKRSTLAAHARTHTGERPYACDVEGCGYAATKRGDLVAHARTHTLKVQDVVPTGGGCGTVVVLYMGARARGSGGQLPTRPRHAPGGPGGHGPRSRGGAYAPLRVAAPPPQTRSPRSCTGQTACVGPRSTAWGSRRQ